MARNSENRFQVIRVALSFAVVFVVLHFSQSSDVLSEVTRPFVAHLIQLVGLPVIQGEDSLVIGRLNIPWSRDCAGLNVLAILWAMTLWTNRFEPSAGRYLLRLALAVIAAFIANVARILTLITYRHFLFPSVESPQLHYFMGFLWLVPVVWFFCPRGERTVGRYALETLHLAAALSLLAPLISSPGGSFVALSALLLLASSRLELLALDPYGLRLSLWMATALMIGTMRMESLWLPWLLACPVFSSFRLAFTPAGLALLAGSIPLVAMHRAGQIAVLLAAAFMAWRWQRSATPQTGEAPAGDSPIGRPGLALVCVVSLALILPFAASPLNGLFTARKRLPAAAMAQDLGSSAYRLRLLAQPPDLDLVCYEPTGEGRHHAIEVCLRYRGVTLSPTEVADVKTDGELWMREFFLQGDTVLLSYKDYLKRTFLPLSPAGFHLIATCPKGAMSAETFAESSRQSAVELAQMLGNQSTARSRSSVARTLGTARIERF